MTGDIPACGMITRIDAAHTKYVTWTNLVGGDDLDLRLPVDPVVTRVPIHLTIPAVAGADRFDIRVGRNCEAVGVVGDSIVMVDDRCRWADGRITIVASAMNSQQQYIDRYSIVEGITLADAMAAPVQMPAFVAGIPSTIHVTNAGSDTLVNISAWTTSHGGSFFNDVSSGGFGGSSGDITWHRAAFGDGTWVQSFFSTPYDQASAYQFMPLIAGDIEFDAAMQLLPTISGVTPNDDLTRPTLAWSADAGEDTTVVTFKGQNETWAVVVPAGVRALRIPQVPSEMQFPEFILRPHGIDVDSYESSLVTSWSDHTAVYRLVTDYETRNRNLPDGYRRRQRSRH